MFNKYFLFCALVNAVNKGLYIKYEIYIRCHFNKDIYEYKYNWNIHHYIYYSIYIDLINLYIYIDFNNWLNPNILNFIYLFIYFSSNFYYKNLILQK